MPYYPKHFIKTNLYTNGGEYVLKGTDRSYTGDYWQTGNGRYFTGATPQVLPTYEIIPINTNLTEAKGIDTGYPQFVQKTKLALPGDGPETMFEGNPYNLNMVLEYLAAKKTTPDKYPNRFIPSYNPTLPTQEDYEVGEFRRYFCKKVNEIAYIEVSQETYTAVANKSPQITYELYIAFNLPWAISGDKDQVRKTNRNITEYASVRRNLPKLGEYLKFDYLKYYK